MYVERLDVDGFRNCCESVRFDPSLTLLVGENNSGKSSIIDALRLALVAESGSERLRPQLSDFTHGRDGRRISEEFSITVVLGGLSVVEQGRFSLALSPKEGHGKARIGLRARIAGDEEIAWYRCGGDFDRPDVERRALNAVQHTYVSALQNPMTDLQPGRRNRLSRLLYALAPDPADRDRLLRVAQKANEDLAEQPKIRRAVDLIQGTLGEMMPNGHRQAADIAFADAEFVALGRQLLPRLGDAEAHDLAESGLGHQSLFQLAVLLAQLETADPQHVPLGVLLIEEPEAHLHPQLQGLLMRHLQDPGNDGGGRRQAIVASNSPHLAASAEVGRVVVLARPGGGRRATAHPVARIELSQTARGHLRRFLEATKAPLFFARGLILVNGACEQLLLPHFARLIGRDLATSGVSVVNTGGLPLGPIARLFDVDGLPVPCAIVSDGDADPAALEGDAPRLQPMQRLERLRGLRGGHVDVFAADVSLEWDLAMAQPRDPLLVESLAAVDPEGDGIPAGPQLSPGRWATRFCDRLPDRAAFAQELAARLEADPETRLVVPGYLRAAIEHVTAPPRPAAQQNGHGDPGR